MLEGDFELTVGEQTATAGPSSMVFVPRETVHAFKHVGSTRGRTLEWGTPGGQERYFEAIDQLAAKGALNPESWAAISGEFANGVCRLGRAGAVQRRWDEASWRPKHWRVRRGRD